MQFVVIVMATLGNKCSIHLTVNCTLSVRRMKVYTGMEIGVESMAQTRTYEYVCMCTDIQGAHTYTDTYTSQVNAVIA